MLGNAVRIRDCPATVSAPVWPAVESAAVRKAANKETTGSEPARLISGKVAARGASQETGPWRSTTACVPRGTEEPSMHFSSQLRLAPARFLILILLSFAAVSAGAASIRGVVTDASGAKVTGATVDLLYAGNVIASTVSRADGSFEILTGVQGRFYLLVSAKSFRNLKRRAFLPGGWTPSSAISFSS